MKKSSKGFIIALILLLTFTVSGCWDQKIYENVGFILQIGIEQSKTGGLQFTLSSPVTDPRRSEQVEFFTTEADLLREFREKSRLISPKTVQGGKIQQIVFSDSLARKGIHNLLEIFERAAENQAMSYVVISETNPQDLIDFMQKLGDKPRPSFYLDRLIKDNSTNGYTVDTSIYDFTVDYFAPGIDPIAPLINKETEGAKGVKVKGSALFSGDKYVGKIDYKQTSLLLLMKGKINRTEYIFRRTGPPKDDYSGKAGTAVSLKIAKRKINIKIANNIPIVNIKLAFKGNYDEHEWNHIDTETIQKNYERMMEEELKYECTKILTYTQQVGSDQLGIGDMVRAKYNSYWKKLNWTEKYMDVIFNVDVEVDISGHGIID